MGEAAPEVWELVKDYWKGLNGFNVGTAVALKKQTTMDDIKAMIICHHSLGNFLSS